MWNMPPWVGIGMVGAIVGEEGVVGRGLPGVEAQAGRRGYIDGAGGKDSVECSQISS